MALMVWMATWWLSEAIDISATALLPIVVLPLTHAATIGKATAPYGSEFIFLFMGGFILALSMQRWGLDKRVALMTLRVMGSSPRAMVAGFMISTFILGCFVSNTATAVMMMPVGLSVIELVKAQSTTQGEREKNFSLCVMLGIAYAASIGGVATVIGTPPNVFLVSFIEKTIEPAYRQEIGFARWMIIGMPLVAVFLPVTWLLLTRVLFPIRMSRIEGGRSFLNRAYRDLGPMNRGEKITSIVFLLTAALWMTRPWLSQIALKVGDDVVHPLAGLSDAGIAILAAILLFVIPVNWRTRDFAMNWSSAVRLPWGILILFGGGLSLSSALEANGVAEFISHQTSQFNWLPPLAIIIIVAASITFFSELASNTATATTFIPILAAVAPGLGLHPYMLIFPACFAASFAFMMPVGTPPNALVFGTGYVTMQQMIKAGFWLNLLGVALVTAATYFIVKPVFM